MLLRGSDVALYARQGMGKGLFPNEKIFHTKF